MLLNEFILFSYQEAPKYTNGQHKLSTRHAKWIEYLQAFSFVIKHKVQSQNQVYDAFSRHHLLVTTMYMHEEELNVFCSLSPDDLDFHNIYTNCGLGTNKEFFYK